MALYCDKSKTSVLAYFLEMSESILMKFSKLFLKLMLNLFRKSIFKGETFANILCVCEIYVWSRYAPGHLTTDLFQTLYNVTYD